MDLTNTNRHSIIRHRDSPTAMFYVELYEYNELVETRELPGKSIHYAEDVSYNWDTGIIKLENNK